MRHTLVTLTIASILLMPGQKPSAGLSEQRNVQCNVDHDKVVQSRLNDEAQLPSTLVGASSKQINIGPGVKFLPDLLLLDQDGRQVRFYSDLIKDKIVLINFFYTSCTYTCLRQGRVFSDLQAELGERLGKDIFLISVTMDPEMDTPERLKSWGAQYGIRKGWTLVTGGKAEMAKLVGHLTGNPLGRIEMHSPFIYLGNDKKNKWTAVYGLAGSKNLVKQIEAM